MDDISLQQFTAMDQATNVASYVHALEAFDGIEQLQELKVIARLRGGIARGCSILDVGCGFGLETLRLASLMATSGKVAGIENSVDFIAETHTRIADPLRAVSALSERDDTRIANPRVTSNPKRTQQNFSTLPLLCHRQTAMGK